jgi:hypothetical protein
MLMRMAEPAFLIPSLDSGCVPADGDSTLAAVALVFAAGPALLKPAFGRAGSGLVSGRFNYLIKDASGANALNPIIRVALRARRKNEHHYHNRYDCQSREAPHCNAWSMAISTIHSPQSVIGWHAYSKAINLH